MGTPFGFSPELFLPRCGLNTTGCQTCPPLLVLPGTWVPGGLALILPVAVAPTMARGVGIQGVVVGFIILSCYYCYLSSVH